MADCYDTCSEIISRDFKVLFYFIGRYEVLKRAGSGLFFYNNDVFIFTVILKKFTFEVKSILSY
jgi:hypothetical protein